MEEIKKRKKKKKRGDLLTIIVIVAALGVFIYSGYNLLHIFLEYQKGSNEYKELEQSVIVELVPGITQEDLPEEKQEILLKIDFNKLKEINSDVVGWIHFENPDKINYPMVAGVDNSKYLTQTFEGTYNTAGTLFIDMNNSNDFSDRNTIVYGHNMKNGSMFSKLREYQNKSFCAENPYFHIYTPDGMVSKYEIFAVSIVKDTSATYFSSWSNDAEFSEYVNYVRSTALFDTGVEVGAGDSMVTLSTCTNVRADERLVVHAVKVSTELVEE